MPNVISQIATQLPQPSLPQAVQTAGETLRSLIEENAYVGEVVALGYAKGRLTGSKSRVYLGDSRKQIDVLARRTTGRKAKLLFTSPPYQGVTNYFYDQWLRLWLLGGPNQPQSAGEQCKHKFSNRREYVNMLQNVFLRSKPLLSRDSVIYVRTDTRKFTLDATIEALARAFPRKQLRSETRSTPEFTQTTLFDSDADTKGEVDLVMW
jgi:hypothetical protein